MRFAHERRAAGRGRVRSHGAEMRVFAQGLVAARPALTNDQPIAEAERLFRGPQGLRPDAPPR